MNMIMRVSGDVIKGPFFGWGGRKRSPCRMTSHLEVGRAGGGCRRVVPRLAMSSDTSLYRWPAGPLTHCSRCPFSQRDFWTLNTHAACLTGRLVLSAEDMSPLQSRRIF